MELKEQTIFSQHPALHNKDGIASTSDYEICRLIMRSASRRYAFASRFLPSDKLRYVEALYAFLRVGDDRVDVSHEGFPSPLAAIDDWEESYRKAFHLGTSSNPVLRAYLDTAIRFKIPESLMDDYYVAMRSDLTNSRYETFSDLLSYVAGSAIPVGRAMTLILGVREPFSFSNAIPHADSLSIAMQLSNFLRDIYQDYQIGRIYLPLEDLDRFRIREADIATRKVSPAFIDLIEFEMKRAEAYYHQAYPGIAMLKSGRWGVMSGLQIYRAILQDIRRIGYDVFNRRADISDSRKLLLVAKSFWLTQNSL